MNIKHEHMKWYMENGFHYVPGYCKNYVVKVLDIIESSPYNKKGFGIAEIGVHIGRLYFLLNRTVTNSNYKSYAIDLYENYQEKNLDKSGKGNKTLFLNYMMKYDLYLGENTVIIEGDSTDSYLELENKITPGTLKYISVDGGHQPENVMNDLKLAEKWIDSEGVVIVDDIMHEGWVGVIQGTLKYLSMYPTLQPFAIGYNKLWMCKISMRETYQKMFDLSDISRKNVQMFSGIPITTLEESGPDWEGSHYIAPCGTVYASGGP